MPPCYVAIPYAPGSVLDHSTDVVNVRTSLIVERLGMAVVVKIYSSTSSIETTSCQGIVCYTVYDVNDMIVRKLVSCENLI